MIDFLSPVKYTNIYTLRTMFIIPRERLNISYTCHVTMRRERAFAQNETTALLQTTHFPSCHKVAHIGSHSWSQRQVGRSALRIHLCFHRHRPWLQLALLPIPELSARIQTLRSTSAPTDPLLAPFSASFYQLELLQWQATYPKHVSHEHHWEILRLCHIASQFERMHRKTWVHPRFVILLC